MAELTHNYSKYIGEKFISAYNSSNNTNFTWDDDKSYQPKEPFDMLFFDQDKELGVQHKKVLSDPEREIVQWKKIEPVIDALKRTFKNYAMPALMVHINFHKTPNNKDEIKQLAFWLEEIIIHKISNHPKLTYFSHQANYDDQNLPKIKKWISQLEIQPHPDLNAQGISFMYGMAGEIAKPWIDNFQAIMKIMEHIKSKYANPDKIILLLENYTFPVDEYYKKEIIEGVKDYPFKQIWIVETFQTITPVFCIKPALPRQAS